MQMSVHILHFKRTILMVKIFVARIRISQNKAAQIPVLPIYTDFVHLSQLVLQCRSRSSHPALQSEHYAVYLFFTAILCLM